MKLYKSDYNYYNYYSADNIQTNNSAGYGVVIHNKKW